MITMSNNFAAKVASAYKFLYLLVKFEAKPTGKKDKKKTKPADDRPFCSCKFLSPNWMLGTPSEKGIKASTT